MQIITEEFIEFCKTIAGGFTSKTVKILTGTHKPSSGWKIRCLGQEISDKDIAKIKREIERRNEIILTGNYPGKELRKKRNRQNKKLSGKIMAM
jgi:hypothetical protein